MVLISSYLRANEKRLFTILFGIFGAARMAVGIFPGDTGNLHGYSALVWFVVGPVSAIVAYRLEGKPFAYFSVVIGAFALVDLVLSFGRGSQSAFYMFGRGGTENGRISSNFVGNMVRRLRYGLISNERRGKQKTAG